MKTGGFVPWDEWKPVLNTFTCPCCMQLESKQYKREHKNAEDIRNAICSFEIEQMKKSLEQTKAVMNG